MNAPGVSEEQTFLIFPFERETQPRRAQEGTVLNSLPSGKLAPPHRGHSERPASPRRHLPAPASSLTRAQSLRRDGETNLLGWAISQASVTLKLEAGFHVVPKPPCLLAWRARGRPRLERCYTIVVQNPSGRLELTRREASHGACRVHQGGTGISPGFSTELQ